MVKKFRHELQKRITRLKKETDLKKKIDLVDEIITIADNYGAVLKTKFNQEYKKKRLKEVHEKWEE